MALWKSPDAQKNWAFWEYLCCSSILGTLKRLEIFSFKLFLGTLKKIMTLEFFA